MNNYFVLSSVFGCLFFLSFSLTSIAAEDFSGKSCHAYSVGMLIADDHLTPLNQFLRSRYRDDSQSLDFTQCEHKDCVIQCLTIVPGDTHFVTGASNGRVYLWSILKKKCKKIFEGHTQFVNALVATHDGKNVISCSDDATVRVWDLTQKKQKYLFEGHANRVNAAAVSTDDQFCITGSDDNTLRVWDLAKGVSVISLPGFVQPRLGAVDIVIAVKVCSNRYYLAQSAYSDVRIWDQQGTFIRDIPGDAASVWQTNYTPCAVSPDGTQCIVGSGENARMLHVASGTLIKELPGHDQRVNVIDITSDGNFCIIGSDAGRVRLWNLKTLELVGNYTFGDTIIHPVKWIGNNRYFLIGRSDNRASIWDFATGRCIVEGLFEIPPATLDVTADAKHLVVRSRNVVLWDLSIPSLVHGALCNLTVAQIVLLMELYDALKNMHGKCVKNLNDDGSETESHYAYRTMPVVIGRLIKRYKAICKTSREIVPNLYLLSF